MAIRADIIEFESAKLTIEQQRANILTEYERATITKEIIEKNEWLATNQYWAKTKLLNWYYDKSILDVKSIR